MRMATLNHRFYRHFINTVSPDLKNNNIVNGNDLPKAKLSAVD